MTLRPPILLAGLVLVAAAAGTMFWLSLPAAAPDTAAPAEILPIPPVPPRIAGGRDYEQCLELLETDPAAAATFARGWKSVDGGDGATHCLALASIALGHPAEGAASLEELADTSSAAKAARAVVYAQASQAWLIAEQPAPAYAAVTKALILLPDDADMLVDRAVVADNLAHYANSLADLDHANQVDPGRTDILALRAAAWRHVGRLDAAQADVEQALAIDPDFPDALLERGILRQRQGDPAGAREDWERAMELAPDSPTADLAEQNLALLDAGPDRK